MSYNGSGTFQINTSGQPVVAGTVISSTAFNALTADLATGLSTAITKDGQTTTTARIPFAAGINSSLTTDSSSTTTGSIITAGGVGIVKNLYVGANTNIAGTLGVTGVATFSAAPIYSSLTASSAVATDASKALVSVTNTGTGNNVLATSPTLVTPILGTPQSGTLTNATGLPLSTGVTGVLPEANGGTGLTSVLHTVQVFTSGSGTYTTPANVKAIWVRMVGGGAGGGGTGTGTSGGNGGTGGNSTFGSLTAGGGTGGSGVGGAAGGVGGTSSGGDLNLQGGTGGGNNGVNSSQNNGGNGGNSVFGGGAGIVATGGNGGTAGATNTGGGGAGAGSLNTTGGGCGGGSGGYCEKLINSPAATYSYAVGAAGTAGTAGTSGSTGGAGGSGVMIVTEYYV
jgi:hypothetical protein